MPTSTVYTCRVTNWPILWLNVFGTLAVPFMALTTDGPLTVPGIIVVVVILIAIAGIATSTSQRVVANSRGLTTTFGLLGFPRVTIPGAAITHAEIIDIPLSDLRGWGIFWTPKRGWFLTLRSGPALRLHTIGGRTLTISVPQPPAALHALALAP